MESFDLLEQKVRKAADLVVKLRKENKALEEDLGKARGRLHEAEKRVLALEKANAGSETKDLEHEVKTLRHERDEIRKRIGRLVEVLETLD